MAVIVAHPAAGAFFLRREMLYTAVTRAKLATVIVGTREVIARAARTPDTGRRHSRLGREVASRRRLERHNLVTTVDASAQTSPSPRKRHALELFAGLPRAYDWMGAVLSFGQDPRWRATLVDQVNPLPGQRVLDVATGTGLVAFALAPARLRGRRPRPERGRCSPRRARTSSDARRSRARHASSGARPSGSRSTTASSTRSRSPTCCATSTTAAATMRELARVVKPGGRIGMVEFGVPARRPAARRLAAATPASGCRCSDALVSPAWVEVGRFLGPNIEELLRAASRT